MTVQVNRSVSLVTIRHLLVRLGATSKYVGFNYIAYAIYLAIMNEDYLFSVTTRLYPEVAKQYGSNAKAVERAIRTLISVIWEKNPPLLNKIAGYTLPMKPSSGEFIALMTEHLLFVVQREEQ